MSGSTSSPIGCPTNRTPAIGRPRALDFVVPQNCIAINDPSLPYSPANCSGYNIAPSVDNEPTTDNVAFFLQDSFKVLPHLTINGGLRYETQSRKDVAGNTGSPVGASGLGRVLSIAD